MPASSADDSASCPHCGEFLSKTHLAHTRLYYDEECDTWNKLSDGEHKSTENQLDLASLAR